MTHLKPVSKPPQRASIDLNTLFNTKVETKENVINGKASGLAR